MEFKINQLSVVSINRACDYIPFISTVTSITIIVLKILFIVNQSSIKDTNSYSYYVINKSWSRCVILLLPVLGNLLIMIADQISSYVSNQKKEQDTERSEQPLPFPTTPVSMPVLEKRFSLPLSQLEKSAQEEGWLNEDSENLAYLNSLKEWVQKGSVQSQEKNEDLGIELLTLLKTKKCKHLTIKNIETLPPLSHSFFKTHLEYLTIKDCDSLKDLDLDSYLDGFKISELIISKCKEAHIQLDLSKHQIESLKVEICESLTLRELSPGSLEASLSNCTLDTLKLSFCNHLNGLSQLDLTCFKFLQALELKFCKSLASIKLKNSQLKNVEIIDCKSLSQIAIEGTSSPLTVSILDCQELKRVDLLNCKEIKHLNIAQSSLNTINIKESQLQKLTLLSCKELKELPLLRGCSELTVESCTKVKKIDLATCDSTLFYLNVTLSPLEEIPSGLENCIKLQKIILKCCSESENKPAINLRIKQKLNLEKLTKLEKFFLTGLDKAQKELIQLNQNVLSKSFLFALV